MIGEILKYSGSTHLLGNFETCINIPPLSFYVSDALNSRSPHKDLL